MSRAVLFAALLAPSLGQAAPLSDAEKAAFARQIAPCWSISALSRQAQATVVTVRFRLDRMGRPERDSFALIGAGKDTRQPVKDAYAAAKRAVLRCGVQGYKLPLEKFVEWKDIEMTFNPERTQSQ